MPDIIVVERTRWQEKMMEECCEGCIYSVYKPGSDISDYECSFDKINNEVIIFWVVLDSDLGRYVCNAKEIEVDQ